jgi:hypothetical protein
MFGFEGLRRFWEKETTPKIKKECARCEAATFQKRIL